MTFSNEIIARVTAAFAAVVATTSLLVSSFANPHATTIAGLLA